MKTLQIGMGWFPERSGGLNRVYYDCYRYLPFSDIEIEGLLVGSNKDQIAQETDGKVIAFASPKDSFIKSWFKIREDFRSNLKQGGYDVIVSHFALYTFPVLNLLNDLPLIIHFQGPWALESKVEGEKFFSVKLRKTIEQITYSRSSKLIVLCQEFRNILHQEYKVPLDKIHVVPPGVDIDRFNINLSPNEARKQLNWHQDRPTIFCIRRLAKRMGLENLITAIVPVRDRYPDIMLYIAGKGALAETLQTQITELGLTNNVNLLGYVPDEQLPVCYRAANFSVVPTVALEGFGLIVIESLAAGTPVLGTPIGGIPETLRPFSEDLVFEGCNSDQLAKGIIEVLSGDRVLPSNQACLDYVQANYNWQKIAQQIKLVYQSALN